MNVPPCKPDLVNLGVNHDVLRGQTREGRCPICDLEVSRPEFMEIYLRCAMNPELRDSLFAKRKDPEPGEDQGN